MIYVNGEPTEIAPGSTVADVLAALGVTERRGLAVAVDAEVVPRGAWPSTSVSADARVEVVRAVQGG